MRFPLASLLSLLLMVSLLVKKNTGTGLDDGVIAIGGMEAQAALADDRILLGDQACAQELAAVAAIAGLTGMETPAGRTDFIAAHGEPFRVPFAGMKAGRARRLQFYGNYSTPPMRHAW